MQLDTDTTSSMRHGPLMRHRPRHLGSASVLFAVLGLLAALLAATPADGATGDRGAQPAAAAYYYAHLGDSYASGPGAGNYAVGAPCWRSNNSYASVWASQYDVVFTNDSCSSGTITSVINGQGGNLGARTNRVTITVGGNDIGFAEIIQACRFGIGDCTTANANARTRVDNLLPGRLSDLLYWIGNRAPNARIVLTGYPLPYNATAACPGAVAAVFRADINSTIRRLNEGLANAAANYPNVAFADVDPNFAGHRLCDGGTRYINDIGTSDWNVTGKAGMYHPTAEGHRFGFLPAVAAL